MPLQRNGEGCENIPCFSRSQAANALEPRNSDSHLNETLKQLLGEKILPVELRRDYQLPNQTVVVDEKKCVSMKNVSA